MKDVAVIIVSWNTVERLRDCLAQLDVANSASWMQVIVSDNGSTDGSAVLVREQFPSVVLIASETNLGFGKANNLGLNKADARYVTFLNSDTLVTPDILQHLVRHMDTHPDVGIISPLLRTRDGSPQSFAFGSDPTIAYLIRRGLSAMLFKRSLHNWDVRRDIEVDWVSGACLMIRRKAIEAAGGFDENLFLYFEDNDLCLRVRKKGWKIVYDGTCSITHFGGESMRRNPSIQHAYQESMRYFHYKHYGKLSAWLLNIFLPLYTRMAR